MKIGIIGAENTHSAAISHTINVNKAVRGFTVDYLWGETEEFARKTAEKGQIPNIVKSPRAMLGKIDALIVDHRHARYHLPAALPFLKAGIPVFVDKPFCYRSAEGRKFLSLARRKGVAVTSFSSLPFQQDFAALRQKVTELGGVVGAASFGPCDLDSQHGGVFFYGIHQVEMVLEICGYDVVAVQVTRHGGNGIGQLFYKSGMTVPIHFLKGWKGRFSMTVIGPEGSHHQALGHDKDPYLAGIRKFTGMFKTGRPPRPYDEILKPVQVLEALERSVKTGRIEKVR